MTTVELIRGALTWESGLAVDADGSPHAYHPNGGGLDALGNAGHFGNWYGLACSQMGIPYVQLADDPAPGFYVSTTALVDHARIASDPRRYVDSETVPYVVVPPELRNRGVHLGDVAVVSYGGRNCAAVVADVGPHGHYGEGSCALAKALGLDPSPRHGGCAHGVTWVIFCGSARGWPRTVEDFTAQATELYATWTAAQSVA